MNPFALIIAGVVAGVFMPIFSRLPILNLVNVVPCGWIWIGGILAVGLYRWLIDADEPMIASGGVIIGIFTGIVAAFTSLILTILLEGITPSPEPSTSFPVLDRILETSYLANFKHNSFMFLFLLNLIFYPMISAISGWVGIQLFRKSASHEVTYRGSDESIQIE